MSRTMTLPSDGDRTAQDLKREELALLRDVIESGTLGSNRGTQVKAFERAFAARYGVSHARAVSAGTAAVHTAIAAIDPEPGDEIITTTVTDMGAIAPILFQQAIPIFADVDPVTLNLTPETVAARITPRTRAIIVTHLFGNPCNVAEIARLATARGIPVIEDCGQAYLATQNGQLAGTIGRVGVFSLQQGRHITTGEGGAMITNRQDVYELAIDVHDCAGSVRRGAGLPRFPGWNFRASELQGAVARVQLSKLDGLLARMRENHAELSERVGALPGLTLRRRNDDGGDAGICLIAFTGTAAEAAESVAALRDEGVAAMRIYDPDVVDLHVYPYWQPVLDAVAAAGRPLPDCPRTLDLVSRTIHVDVSPLCDEQDIEEIANAFKKVASAVTA